MFIRPVDVSHRTTKVINETSGLTMDVSLILLRSKFNFINSIYSEEELESKESDILTLPAFNSYMLEIFKLAHQP